MCGEIGGVGLGTVIFISSRIAYNYRLYAAVSLRHST
jgi:hypothetical protein